MEDEKLKKIKKYLKLREIEKEDYNNELIKEMYEKKMNNSNGVNKSE